MSTERYHKLSLLFAYSSKKIAPLSILRKRQVKISPRSLKYYFWILCEQDLQFRHFPEEKKKQVEIDQFYFLLSFLTAGLYMLLYIQQQDRVKYMHGKSLQSCLTLCDPMVSSPPFPLSVGFSRQEYWSGLPCPPPGDLPDPGIESVSYFYPGRWVLYQQCHQKCIFSIT